MTGYDKLIIIMEAILVGVSLWMWNKSKSGFNLAVAGVITIITFGIIGDMIIRAITG